MSAEKSTLDRARVLLGVGRADEAHRILSQHLAGQPQDPKALTLLALAHLQNRREADALRATDAALAIAPEYFPAWDFRSTALRKLGRHPEAVESATELVRLAPNQSSSHFELGMALRALRRGQPEMLAAARRAVELAPDDADAHVLLGLAHSDLAQPEQAEQCYRRALAIDPNHGDARSNLAALEFDRGNLSEAKRGFQEAAANSPQDTRFHRNIAIAEVGGLIALGCVLGFVVVAVAVLMVLSGPAGLLDSVSDSLLHYRQGTITPWPWRAAVGVVFVAAWPLMIRFMVRRLSRRMRGEVVRALLLVVRLPAYAMIVGTLAFAQLGALVLLFLPSPPPLLADFLGVLAAVAGFFVLFRRRGAQRVS